MSALIRSLLAPRPFAIAGRVPPAGRDSTEHKRRPDWFRTAPSVTSSGSRAYPGFRSFPPTPAADPTAAGVEGGTS